jgi:hypothetical protein
MKKLKFILPTILIVSVLSFSGCFGSGGDGPDTEEPSDTGFTVYATNQFEIDVPSEWEVIDRKDFTSEVPNETVVVFRNNVKNETFTANVNIVANNLQKPVSSLEYAKLVNNRQKSGLIEYSEKSKDEIKIRIGDQEVDTFLTAFEARIGTDDNLVRYIQTYGVQGSTAYIVSGAVSPSESESVVQRVEKIVKSIRLK